MPTLRPTIDLAHNMGHRVIAEGVDNAEVVELLKAMGCDYAQGYYIRGRVGTFYVPTYFLCHL